MCRKNIVQQKVILNLKYFFLVSNLRLKSAAANCSWQLYKVYMYACIFFCFWPVCGSQTTFNLKWNTSSWPIIWAILQISGPVFFQLPKKRQLPETGVSPHFALFLSFSLFLPLSLYSVQCVAHFCAVAANYEQQRDNCKNARNGPAKSGP